MEVLFKAVAGALVAVVLVLVLTKQNKEVALLTVTAVCCMIAVSAMQYLSPVLDYFDQLRSLGGLDEQVLQILLKSVGIALLAEITTHICTDSGNGALGKTIQLLATAAILWLSLPLFGKLMELIEHVLVSV